MRVLLADDHALIRDGMKQFLVDLADEVEVIEASTFDEATIAASAGEAPDLAILDLRMPGMEGLNGLTWFKERFPMVPVVIISGQFRNSDISAAMEKGARGYIPKTTGGEAMLNALRLVLAGERYLPSVFMEAANSAAAGSGGDRGVGTDSPLAKLTKREWEVLGKLVEGGSNKQIGLALGLEEITVKIHLRNVYRKIGVVNRAQAVRVAMLNGWEEA